MISRQTRRRSFFRFRSRSSRRVRRLPIATLTCLLSWIRCTSSIMARVLPVSSWPLFRDRELTLRQKTRVLLIMRQERLTKSETAVKFNLSPSQVQRLCDQRQQVLGAARRCVDPKVKRLRSCKGQKVGIELYKWFKNTIPIGAKIKGEELRLKAASLASGMEPNFTPSLPWINRWKERFGVQLYRGQHVQSKPKSVYDLTQNQTDDNSDDDTEDVEMDEKPELEPDDNFVCVDAEELDVDDEMHQLLENEELDFDKALDLITDQVIFDDKELHNNHQLPMSDNEMRLMMKLVQRFVTQHNMSYETVRVVDIEEKVMEKLCRSPQKA